MGSGGGRTLIATQQSSFVLCFPNSSSDMVGSGVVVVPAGVVVVSGLGFRV